MTFFDETKSIIENLYYLSGSLLLIVALFGLRQLKIAKDSVRINSQRQSAILAFELCEKYFKELASLYRKLITKMTELDIDFEKIEKLDLHELDKINSDNKNFTEYKKVLDNHDKLHYELWLLADKLESFSIPFIKKIADEALAYNNEFLKFYQYCNLCSVEIIETRKKRPNENAIYENVIELYSIWKSRNEKEQIQNQVASLISKEKSIVTKKIKPIGTE